MLLDTHVWRWHFAGDATRIGPHARRRIEQARSQGGLVVSVASMFELAALSAAGRLTLAPSAESWMRQSIELGHRQVAEITTGIAIEAGSIPTAALPDPLDRFLVATIRSLGVPIVTRDGAIRDYITSRRIGRAVDASQ